ncbi:MAG: hypothetical protein JWM78_3212 [Verrucomicrobiaceae bacterium]|nr:hypothetical protein [Verrucomicrobiaceae bacterium]
MEGLINCLPAFRRRALMTISVALFALPAAAGSLEQAKRIHDRLAGVPPSASVLLDMKNKIDSNDKIGAAFEAMDNKAFYNATLKNWAAPWTNRDGDKFAPLNDYSATVIGIVRDQLDYRSVLYDDILYVGETTAPVTAPYSNSDNANYQQLEANDVNLGDATKLVKKTQSQVTGLPSTATAGVITSRAAARAFFIDGTNRAMFRFTLKNHLCNDMEQVQEITRPSDRIRRDVSRSPGGDSRIFMNTCIGCHSGMDPMAQAFAYYNYSYPAPGSEDSGHLEYTVGVVQPKYHINENHFMEGYNTPNDHWDNYWRSGPNTAILGWAAGAGSGDGAKSMAQELANSDAFAVCSVKKVFQTVCLRAPAPGDQSAFTAMLTSFKTNNYNLKHTFAEAAVYCAGN